MRKYHNVPVEIDGHIFPSKHEAARYCELVVLERTGEISNLLLHPSYDISHNGANICKYVADFEYLTRGGKRVIEDAKGVRTPVYRLKKKMMKVICGLDIVEV